MLFLTILIVMADSVTSAKFPSVCHNFLSNLFSYNIKIIKTSLI